MAERSGFLALLAMLVMVPTAAIGEGPPSWVRVHIAAVPLEAKVGDRIEATLTVDLPTGARLDAAPLGPELGPFAVISGAWRGPESVEQGQRWIWSGSLASFRTGVQTIPPVRIRVQGQDGREVSAETVPVEVTIGSVLGTEQAEGEPKPADIKPPAAVPANYRPLLAASGILVLLLAGALLLWWLHRRYAARLAAVPVPDDPFRRTPPHVWVYAELQKLLERRLGEQGHVDQFFAELASIVKRYLGGRYRVDLMERTTEEVPERLRQAGAADAAIRATQELLVRADMVKFAREAPGPEECRAAVDEAYRIVDMTKPATAEPVAERGAA